MSVDGAPSTRSRGASLNSASNGASFAVIRSTLRHSTAGGKRPFEIDELTGARGPINPGSMVKARSARGIVVAFVVVLGSGPACGGGSSNGAGGQACSAYGAAFCKRLYACTPAEMQDAEFHSNFGSSEAQCAQQEALICNATLPPGQTSLGTNCSGGKHVNMAALTLCQSQLETVACTDFLEDQYANNCADVCVSGGTTTSGSGGNGTTGSGGGTGSGGSSPGSGGNSGSTTAAVIAFCKSTNDRICDLAFQCTPAANRDANFIGSYGTSASACKTMQEAQCTTATAAMCVFDAAAAANCQAAFNAADCDTDLFSIIASTSCSRSCGP